ncbi:MAG: hypothetical protein DI535_22805 [Citrobacter freundii]|nr:MAG: hypothetical protein DI535_22805 [Citrobacter freundii]
MRPKTWPQSNALSKPVFVSFITGILLFATNISLQAQPTRYLTQFAGTGVSGYYAGDNNDAVTAQFSSIKGVAVDASGNVLITDYQNYCIRKVGTDGKVSVIAGIPKTSGSASPYPSGVAATTAIPAPGGHITVAGNGDIYFMGNGFSIGKISNGNLSYFIPATMSGTGSLGSHYTLKARGNYLYLGSGQSVNVIDLSTQKQVRSITVSGSTSIRGLALDASNNIYTIGTSGLLSKIDGTTFAVSTLVAANADPDLWVISADMAIDNDGNILIASNFDYILKVAATNYARSKIYGEGGAKYIGIAVGAGGELYPADQSKCKVPKIIFLDANNYLRSLTVSPGTLNSTFSYWTTSYTVSVPNNVDKFTVTPTVDAATTSMQVRSNGGTYTPLASGATSAEMNLNVGTNTVNIYLAAQHPSYTNTYTITVTRQAIPPATPINVVATPGRNSVRLDWDASPGATKYKVLRGTASNNITTVLATPTTNTYTDNAAVVGTTYYYAIIAIEPTTNAESAQTAGLAAKANTPPVISGLSITGNFWVTEQLTADYTYSDVDGGSNSSTYLWYRSNDAAGAGKAAISGATARTYTVVPADFGKYLSVRVTPNDGISTGTVLESARAVVTVGTLPVKLVYFKAKPVAGSVQITWKTATEINSLHFAIERSVDGRSWETAGTVAAAGESSMPIEYSYTDKNPLPNRSLYRLRTVDRDGHTEFSSTAQIDMNAMENSITIYPIPAINTITVKGGSDNKQLVYAISDATGMNVKKGLLTKSSQQVDITELKKGIYFLKVENNDAIRFIKQ